MISRGMWALVVGCIEPGKCFLAATGGDLEPSELKPPSLRRKGLALDQDRLLVALRHPIYEGTKTAQGSVASRLVGF